MAKLILRPGDRARHARRLRMTFHALKRCAERWVSMRDIQYVLCFGRVWRSWQGLCFQLTAESVRKRPTACGVVVVLGLNHRIRTVYREER